jgi:hypothetical protein
MIRPLVVLAALSACERAEPPPPLVPVNICVDPPAGARWDDSVIVNAFAGTGGNDQDQLAIRTLVRDVVLPSVRSRPDVRFAVYECHEQFRFEKPTRAVAMIILAGIAAWHLRDAAMTLAEARARIEIWPHEPLRGGEPAPLLTIADIEARAREIEDLLDRLRYHTERYGPVMFDDAIATEPYQAAEVNLQVRMLRDNLLMASGRGWDRANWGLDNRLREHGIQSTRTPDPFMSQQ